MYLLLFKVTNSSNSKYVDSSLRSRLSPDRLSPSITNNYYKNSSSNNNSIKYLNTSNNIRGTFSSAYDRIFSFCGNNRARFVSQFRRQLITWGISRVPIRKVQLRLMVSVRRMGKQNVFIIYMFHLKFNVNRVQDPMLKWPEMLCNCYQ